jgi:hypothetical protein
MRHLHGQKVQQVVQWGHRGNYSNM